MKLDECKTPQHKKQELLGLRRRSARIIKALPTNFAMFSSSLPPLLLFFTTIRHLYQANVEHCPLFRAAAADQIWAYFPHLKPCSCHRNSVRQQHCFPSAFLKHFLDTAIIKIVQGSPAAGCRRWAVLLEQACALILPVLRLRAGATVQLIRDKCNLKPFWDPTVSLDNNMINPHPDSFPRVFLFSGSFPCSSGFAFSSPLSLALLPVTFSLTWLSQMQKMSHCFLTVHVLSNPLKKTPYLKFFPHPLFLQTD